MTISIETLALILMLAHLAAAIFMARVLHRQWGLFKIPYDTSIEPKLVKELKRFRAILFSLSVIVFAGNIIPILIDGVTFFYHNPLDRNPTVPVISLAYAVSNALTALISAYLIFTLYRIAKGSNDPNELVEKDIVNRKK